MNNSQDFKRDSQPEEKNFQNLFLFYCKNSAEEIFKNFFFFLLLKFSTFAFLIQNFIRRNRKKKFLFKLYSTRHEKKKTFSSNEQNQKKEKNWKRRKVSTECSMIIYLVANLLHNLCYDLKSFVKCDFCARFGASFFQSKLLFDFLFNVRNSGNLIRRKIFCLVLSTFLSRRYFCNLLFDNSKGHFFSF